MSDINTLPILLEELDILVNNEFEGLIFLHSLIQKDPTEEGDEKASSLMASIKHLSLVWYNFDIAVPFSNEAQMNKLMEDIYIRPIAFRALMLYHRSTDEVKTLIKETVTASSFKPFEYGLDSKDYDEIVNKYPILIFYIFRTLSSFPSFLSTVMKNGSLLEIPE